MKRKKQILVNFMVRIVLGVAIIVCANQIFSRKEIPINVGINVVSLGVAGTLGVPGVAMLYGVVAIPFL